MAITPLVKLSAANRHVWFLSSDGQTIDKIKDNQEIYSLKDYETAEATLSGTSCTLENNTIYSGTIPSTYTFEVADDMNYCSIKMKTPSGTAGPTVNWPTGVTTRFFGNDCSTSDGVTSFTPAASSEYNIAVDRDSDTQITFIVYKLEN